MRGIIYCVHLFGVGHLKRMLTLAKGLVEEGHAITLIQAGRAEDVSFFHPQFTHLLLPLYQGFLGEKKPEEALFKEHMKFRRKKLFSMLDFSRPYDFLITEQIPFSKMAFLFEAYSIMEAVKAVNPRLAVICSQKGGTLPKDHYQKGNEREETLHRLSRDILRQLQKNYHKVLVHCDPQVTRLEEMFAYCEEIRDKIEYTGYIFPRPEKYPLSNRRGKMILVTNGSGDKGKECLKMAAAIVPLLPEYRFLFIASPMMSSELLEFLREASQKNSNMEQIPFLKHLDEKLQECALAITLAGSTLINLYATGTPALVYPDPHDSGQVLLGAKFEQLGIVRLIREEDLTPETLKNLIVDTLAHPPQSRVELNIAGVKNSIRAITELCS